MDPTNPKASRFQGNYLTTSSGVNIFSVHIPRPPSPRICKVGCKWWYHDNKTRLRFVFSFSFYIQVPSFCYYILVLSFISLLNTVDIHSSEIVIEPLALVWYHELLLKIWLNDWIEYYLVSPWPTCLMYKVHSSMIVVWKGNLASCLLFSRKLSYILIKLFFWQVFMTWTVV
jgi:hypothetical protein